MVQERARALEYGYKDPIHLSLDNTHTCFDRCVRLIVDTDGAEVILASHNENSIRLATALLAERGINPTGMS